MSGREQCYRCHKPVMVCICSDVPRVENRTEIRILQHPREQFHPVGTVRFARLGLARAQVAVHDPRDRAEIEARFLAGPGKVALLFPGKNARPLSTLAPEERPDALIVLDGTWATARSLYRDHPWLHALPQVSVTPEIPSLYRIRAEPFLEAVSTIEAIVLALQALEPELEGPAALLDAFVRMIDRQIELGSARVGRKRKPKRRRENRAIPSELVRRPDRVVLVFGELAPAERAGERRALLSWTALRLGDGATFERWLRPQILPSDRHLGHMGLPREALEQGDSIEALAAAWRAFLRPTDVVAAWNQSTLTALAEALGAPVPGVLVKAAYGNARHTGQATGALSEVVAREGLTAPPAALTGRAGRVIGELAAVVELLGTLARTAPLCSAPPADTLDGAC